MKPTSQQKKVMEAQTGNILVSAAAGSGKTSVMTARIVQKVIDDGMDIRSMLVMTFTEAAALNMREKIEQALRRELKDHQDSALRRHLYRQILLIHQSSISTIHSFCLEVIRNFYYELPEIDGETRIEPGFTVEDPAEAQVALASCIDEILEGYYERCDEEPDAGLSGDFLFLADAYGSARSDRPLRELLLAFYLFLRSMPHYMAWAAEALENLRRDAQDIDQSAWFRRIRDGLAVRLENASEGAAELEEIIAEHPQLYKDPEKNNLLYEQYRAFLKSLEGLNAVVSDPRAGWDDLYRYFETIPDLPVLRGRQDEAGIKARISMIVRKHFAELLCYTTGRSPQPKDKEHFLLEQGFVFYGPKEKIQHQMLEMLPGMEMLVRLADDTDRLYTAKKRERNRIDFSDFEHLALEILEKESVRSYYKERFKEVYIDEYQDTSSIQESILQCVTARNCFMVGDVKQSIYRFRHAQPKIFLEKYKGFDGLVYELNTNFRSRKAILDAANDVFYQIMSETAGEIDYDEQQALYAGIHDDDITPPTLLLTDLSDEADDFAKEESGDECDIAEETDEADDVIEEESLTGYEAEAHSVALEIHRLISSGEYPAGGIAVLCRTKRICDVCKKAVDRVGVAAECEQGNEFTDRYEIRVLEALLQICDNPAQDVPLVSVMVSAIPKEPFTEEELLDIRIHAQGKISFYEAATSYAEESAPAQTQSGSPEKGARKSDKTLKEKLRGFFLELEQWRQALTYRSISDFLAQIAAETGIGAHAAFASSSDTVRLIDEFIDWIRSIEDRRSPDLHTLVNLIREIRDRDTVNSPFGIEESRQDAVKIMTLHKSKGLEFPVVFLAGTSRQIRAGAGKEHLIFSQEGGLASCYIRPDEQYRYVMPNFFAMREQMRNADTAEEMRLLYVGLTRAMHRLYVSGTFESQKTREGKGLAECAAKVRRSGTQRKLMPHIVLGGKTYLDWIVMSLARNSSADLSELGIESFSKPVGATPSGPFGESAWTVCVRRRKENARAIAQIQQEDLRVEDREEALRKETLKLYREAPLRDDLAQAIARKYFCERPFMDAAVTPLKVSVSEIKRKEQTLAFAAESGYDSAPIPEWTGRIRGINTTLRPAQSDPDAPIDGAALGIAVHSVLRYAPEHLAGAKPDTEAIKRLLDEMHEQGRISVSELRGLEGLLPELSAYLGSELSETILRKTREGGMCYREIPFTLKMEAARLFQGKDFAADDHVLIQGIIDCWYEEDGKAILIDYKTDRLTGDDQAIAEQLKKRYETQLAVYAEAISRIRGIPVEKILIWLIRSRKAYEISITSHKNEDA